MCMSLAHFLCVFAFLLCMFVCVCVGGGGGRRLHRALFTRMRITHQARPINFLFVVVALPPPRQLEEKGKTQKRAIFRLACARVFSA